jgi:hypothetical protein
MLKTTAIDNLENLINALESTCSGLRDPNRVIVAQGIELLTHLNEILPPDPDPDAVQFEFDFTTKAKPEPEVETKPKRKAKAKA